MNTTKLVKSEPTPEYYLRFLYLNTLRSQHQAIKSPISYQPIIGRSSYTNSIVEEGRVFDSRALKASSNKLHDYYEGEECRRTSTLRLYVLL